MADRIVDAKGMACPMPVVKAKKAMDELQSGQILEVLATEKGSLKDIPAWAGKSGHEVLETAEENGVFRFVIKKG